MPHLEQPTPPDPRPTPTRATTPRVGVTESLIAPGVTALPVVTRRSSTDDLFAALNIAGAAAGVLGEQAKFLIHQQRGVAIRQAKEELPGLLQDIQNREMLIPNGADPGAHSRAIVDERISGSGMSKAAAQAYRDVLVPGLATEFVREQQRMKNEQESASMLFYKDALLQATDAQEVGDILDEMGRELPDVPEAILLGILTEAGTAAANNGDMTRVDAIRAVLGDTNIEQQQKMIRTLEAVNSQRRRTQIQDTQIWVDELHEQRRLGTPLNAIDKFMELRVANPEFTFNEDDRAIQWSNFLILDARIAAAAGDIDGAEEAMRLARLESTKTALIPLLLEARSRASAVAEREGEERIALLHVQRDEGVVGITKDTFRKEIDLIATDPRLERPAVWEDRQIIRLNQRFAREEAQLQRQDAVREKREIREIDANDTYEALINREDLTNAENVQDTVYDDRFGEQETISAETKLQDAHQIALGVIADRFPDPADGTPEEIELVQAQRTRLRHLWLNMSRYVDPEARDLIAAAAAENFIRITPDQVTPLALEGYREFKGLSAANASSRHTNVGDEAFFRDAQVAELHLKQTEAEALVTAGRPDFSPRATDPGGRAFINEKTLQRAVANSAIGEAVTRDTLVFDTVRNIVSFRMRKFGITQEAATPLALETVSDDYMEFNGYLFRKRDVNLPEPTIKLIGDLMIDFYLDDEKNAEFYTKDQLSIRYLEATGEIFVTRLNSGVPIENSPPRISVREMAALGIKHNEATDVETAKIGSHKRLKGKVDDQMRRVRERWDFYDRGWADPNDSLETTRKKGRPRRLFMPNAFWEKVFTDRTDLDEISQEFDPTMPAGTRQIVIDLANHLNENQKEAIRRVTTLRVRPARPGIRPFFALPPGAFPPLPGPAPIPVPPGFRNQ